MSRLIFYLLLMALAFWAVKRVLSLGKRRSGKAPEPGEELVQDPFCQCYIPKSQSYIVSWEVRKLFFCSEDCYKKYQATKSFPKA